MSRTLIISADDFGFSASANEAVLRAAEFGTLRAASLMTNMPFAEAAVAAARKRTPNLSLGLHFTLTSGVSVAPADSVPLLVDAEGRFAHGFGGLLKLLRGRQGNEARIQIRREFEAQLAEADRLANLHDYAFDHLDSHQHVHVLPGIFETIFAESQRRQWVLRIPRERFGGAGRILRRSLHWGPVGILKRSVLRYFLPKTVAGPDYFGILDTGKVDAAAWDSILGVLRNSVTEVNVHPSWEPGNDETTWKCSDGDRSFHRSDWRRREFDVLVDETFRKKVASLLPAEGQKSPWNETP